MFGRIPYALNPVIAVDDHPLIRKGISSYISSVGHFSLVAMLENGNGLMSWIKSGNKADVVLLDRFLPDVDALDLVLEIKASGLKVIMLTRADSHEEISKAIWAGVDGYLFKTCEADQLIAAIKNVSQGQSSFPLNVMQRLTRGELNQGVLDCLTARQLEIVEFVKLGMSNKTIAKKLQLSENTVRNHLCHIMDKLKVSNRVQVAILGWEKDTQPR